MDDQLTALVVEVHALDARNRLYILTPLHGSVPFGNLATLEDVSRALHREYWQEVYSSTATVAADPVAKTNGFWSGSPCDALWVHPPGIAEVSTVDDVKPSALGRCIDVVRGLTSLGRCRLSCSLSSMRILR